MANSRFGKYRLIAELGHGGMADVFLGVVEGPAGFSKLQVIKRLREHLADDAQFVSMLVDEARISARLNHANVVQTLEVGDVNGTYYLVMEFLDGQPLSRIQSRCPRENRPFPEHLQYLAFSDVLAGLHHAHTLKDYDGSPLNIVHRDVTPHNIFVTYDGEVKIVDFGIAKAAGRIAETREGVVKGKLRYMAPEQALGQTLDGRADVFAVGIMLWEAATEQRYWGEIEDIEIIRELLSKADRPKPSAVKPGVPARIDEICRKALAFDPADRYATALEMKKDLDAYLQETGHLVTARHDLSALVSSVFDDKRKELTALIERQLRDLARSDFAPAVVAFDPSPSSALASDAIDDDPLSRKSRTADGPRDGTRVSAGDRRQDRARSKRSKATPKKYVLAPVALAAVSCAVWLASSRRNAHDDAVAIATSQSATTAPPQESVSLTLSAGPQDARFFIDGKPVIGNPFRGIVPRDSLPHSVTALSSVGTETQNVSFERDTVLDMLAGAHATPPPGTGRSATAAPAATQAGQAGQHAGGGAPRDSARPRGGATATSASAAPAGGAAVAAPVATSHEPAPVASTPTSAHTRPRKTVDTDNPYAQ